jgi:hypothetical protein
VTWTWRIETGSGQGHDAGFDIPEFSSQSDAETWLGEVWRDLASGGAGQVTLVESGRVVYGPMSLEDG